MLTFPVPYGDEAAHFSFVQTVATGHGIPVTGRDFITDDALGLYKQNPVTAWRSTPVPPSATDERWGFVREQYEGFQAPLYHFVMAPFFWAGRPFGVLGAFYALRVATLLVTLLSVPLVYWLAKEAFPQRPAVWLLAPLCFVVLQTVSATGATITNDGMMVALGSIALITLLRARRGLTTRTAVAFGVAVGLCALGKGTASALVPALAIGVGGLAWVLRPPARLFARWCAIAVGAAVVLLVPWLAFNLHSYHALTGAKPAARLVAPILGARATDFGGAIWQVRAAMRTSFGAHDVGQFRLAVAYRLVWSVAALVLIVGGAVVAARRRSKDEFMLAAWLAISLPLGLVSLLVVTLNQSGEQTLLNGRHLYVLLPAFCVALAHGAVALGGWRIGAASLVALFVGASWLEVPNEREWVTTNYARAGLVSGAAPVIEHTYGLATLRTRALAVDPPCPVTAISLNVGAVPPPATAGGRALSVTRTEQPWTTYAADPPLTAPTDVRLATDVDVVLGRPPKRALISIPDRPDVSPVGRLYCGARGGGASARFDQLYRPLHPAGLSYAALLAWPIGVAALETVAGGSAVVALLRARSSSPIRAAAADEVG